AKPARDRSGWQFVSHLSLSILRISSEETMPPAALRKRTSNGARLGEHRHRDRPARLRRWPVRRPAPGLAWAGEARKAPRRPVALSLLEFRTVRQRRGKLEHDA